MHRFNISRTMTPLWHRFYTFYLFQTARLDTALPPRYTPRIHTHPGYTPLYTPWYSAASTPGRAYAQKDTPAMEKRLILISHEPIRVSTVKSVCGLDAVLGTSSYSSVLTNKEATFVKFPYGSSATECAVAVYSVFYGDIDTVSHRFLLFYVIYVYVIYSNQGPDYRFWPFRTGITA